MALPPSYLKAIVKLAVQKRAQLKKFKKMKRSCFRPLHVDVLIYTVL